MWQRFLEIKMFYLFTVILHRDHYRLPKISCSKHASVVSFSRFLREDFVRFTFWSIKLTAYGAKNIVRDFATVVLAKSPELTHFPFANSYGAVDFPFEIPCDQRFNGLVASLIAVDWTPIAFREGVARVKGCIRWRVDRKLVCKLVIRIPTSNPNTLRPNTLLLVLFPTVNWFERWIPLMLFQSPKTLSWKTVKKCCPLYSTAPVCFYASQQSCL